MREFPRATTLTHSGHPFVTLEAAVGFARDRAVRTGERQRVSLRTVTAWPTYRRRWVVRSRTEAWSVGDRAWHRGV